MNLDILNRTGNPLGYVVHATEGQVSIRLVNANDVVCVSNVSLRSIDDNARCSVSDCQTDHAADGNDELNFSEVSVVN